MLCSVKTDEGNDGSASSLSLRSFTCNIHLHAPSGMFPSSLVQGCKNAVAPHATKSVESANVFLLYGKACTGCFTIVETKRQLLKPLSMTLFLFLFPDCHREIVNLSIY